MSESQNGLIATSRSAHVFTIFFFILTLYLTFFSERITIFLLYPFTVLVFSLIRDLATSLKIDQGSIRFTPPFGGVQEVKFSEVEKIYIQSIYGYLPFRPPSIEISARNDTYFLRPNTAEFKNGGELIKSIVELSKAQSPNVQVSQEVIDYLKKLKT